MSTSLNADSVIVKKGKNAADLDRFYGTGRRKVASARVWVTRGSGKFIVNQKDSSVYFARLALQTLIKKPLVVADVLGKLDIVCTVKGSGLSGQAGAVCHGLSIALKKLNPTSAMSKMLRANNLLTRDSRVVERKKYGRKKARKRFQFSKR